MNQPLGFFQEAFRVAPVGMLVVDGAGSIVDVNTQLELLFGYSRADLLNQPVELLVHGLAETHRQRRLEFREKPEARPITGRDLFGKHRDGRQIPVEVGLTPLSAPTASVLACVVDLTERKRAEEQFRLAIEAAPNGMLMVDAEGTIVLVNAQIEQLFGYSRAELVGRSVDELLPARYRGGHAGNRRSFFAQPRARPMAEGRELFALRKDGQEFPVEIGLSPIMTQAGLLVLGSMVDITERRRAREALQASLAESEILLKELHHRAKNNLQLIASLLDLASSSPAPGALAECRDRINSIALVHEKLYQSGTFTSIGLSDYLRSLGQQVAHAWSPAEGRIEVKVDADDLSVPLDTAVPCGLIVNELLTNAFKHAFPNDARGTISVRATRAGARIVLTVDDDGTGMPPKAANEPGHLGLELVRALARQLRAELHVTTERGTHITLSFEGGQA